jgi:hypothetical protein
MLSYRLVKPESLAYRVQFGGADIGSIARSFGGPRQIAQMARKE